MAADDDRPFLSRWSRRKSQARSGVPLPDEPPAAPSAAAAVVPEPAPAVVVPAPAPAPAPAPPAVEPAPTMDDVAALTPASDFSRFVAPGVEPGVSNAAMRKLFADPHFNLMDGLDIYIDDYGKPDPIPPDMLRKMVQSKFLGLFEEEDKQEAADNAAAAAPVTAAAAAPAGEAPPAAPAADDNRVHDDHADLQLQPDDAARRTGPDEGAGSGPV